MLGKAPRLEGERKPTCLKDANMEEIVSIPEGKSMVTLKWIYKTKHMVDGRKEKYKVRFLARGFSQKEGEDHKVIFTPISRYTSINIIICINTFMDWRLHQMDIKIFFLNGVIEEEV